MEGGKFHTVHSATTKAVCAASNKRNTGSRAPWASRSTCARARPRARGRAGALDGDGGRLADHGGRTNASAASASPAATGNSTNAWPAKLSESHPMNVACIGMGWWSDVLADAIKRSGKMQIAACFFRSHDKREEFAAKYGCTAAASYEEILGRQTHRSDHQHHAELRAPRDHCRRGQAPASTSSSTSRSPTRSTMRARITEACRKAKVVLALGYQRRRESHFRWIKAKPGDDSESW